LAESLLPLIAEREEDAIGLAMQRLDRFQDRFERAHTAVLRKKLGLLCDEASDLALASRLLALMARHEVDYTLCFRALNAAVADPAESRELVSMFADPEAIRAWVAEWRARLARDGSDATARATTMRRANPALIPRNHRIEHAIAAANNGDLGPWKRLLAALQRPHDDQPEYVDLAKPPKVAERVRATFCGT
jgi:uncharacterized protein YdiU (UPF0061 family)